ncbi:hypothetical protein N7493_000480 [Penicillium malachiteum]|uniref:Rho GTPase activator Rga n=1 Tax=Penicillium malachiteum TaxID=1324776 RepID=A0AAD6N0R4_9EURO|nr:hypothetical protein N7493_000480 [Penicillium malachiteum]
MESPSLQPESPMDQEDIPFPCMGCGEILEEGKAFELSGQRWHIDCFRCSTCNTLLDSDAHLLLLGDGSLICSNCTYSCNSCGNKIEDLAILTGDQAFCAQCFRCRNCKRKIENLRYARTSQGIFCMDCHESLMQRRRKKKATAAASKRPPGPGVKLDKSLPSLPPNFEERQQMMEEDPSEAYLESTPEPASSRVDEANRPGSSASRPTTASDNLILPSSTYRSSRHLGSQRDNDAGDAGGELLIPLTFDPSESQRSSRRQSQTLQETPRDYFGHTRADSSMGAARDGLEPQSHASTEHPSPHIAYQEKGWERTEPEPVRRDLDGVNGAGTKPPSGIDHNRLGKTESARSSRSDLPLALRETSAFSGATSPESSRSKDDITRHIPLESTIPLRPSNELHRLHDHGSADSARSQPSSGLAHLPKRGDSLESKHHQIARKEMGSSPTSSAYGGSPTLPEIGAELPKQNITSGNTSLSDTQRQLDNAGSPSLPQYTSNSDFSQDEDLARFIGGDYLNFRQPGSASAARHNRSFSDKSVRTNKELKHDRSPMNGSISGTDLASPTIGTTPTEELAWLRGELRKERQRVSEMENALRATADVKQVNTELSEKRSTMVVLDAQREIVLRELTVLTDHIESEKRGNSGAPLDLGKLSNHVLRELAESIHKLKDSYTPQIEELIQKRNDLAEELVEINRKKEKAFQEFEQLSSKNAQLAELNNQLVHQIQELYKTNHADHRGPNGLGISHHKERSVTSIEALKPTGSHDMATSISTAHISEDGEPATAQVVPGPQVVSIRKGQPRKFNWKKGGQNVAKGVKGLKGAFMGNDEPGGLPRSQTQDPKGFGFFGNQRNKQGGKMSQADSVSALSDTIGNLYGVDLEIRIEHEKSIIPYIVTRCIQEVELRGMDMEGIYRKSGAASAIQGIREGFERLPFEYDISDPDLDIHAVTSSLKQYFRKLPNPLITYDVYEMIIESGEITDVSTRVEVLQKGLRELPQVHQDVLEFLMFHLKRVVERQEDNLMTSQNIAVVFAPTIMRPESLAREMTDVQKKNDVLRFMVENVPDIFTGLAA